MGKNFYRELENLEIVYDSAMESDISVLVAFLIKYKSFPFYSVGSGGSYTVASAFEELCMKAGWSARAITPLKLSELTSQLLDSVAVLFTASGSNNDSKNAYRYIAESEPQGILTCCMRENAAIKKIQRVNLHNYYYEYRMPVGKDGYLAVESIVSSLVLMSRAFFIATGDCFYQLPARWWFGDTELLREDARQIFSKETIFVLYGGLTTPAAIDLESKFSEASLGNVQLVDFRNFAHGRHFWLSERKDSTAVIALVGTSKKNLRIRH